MPRSGGLGRAFIAASRRVARGVFRNGKRVVLMDVAAKVKKTRRTPHFANRRDRLCEVVIQPQ
ncbi:hypothetical protein [Dyella sp. 2RAB6]|uniref:hypothetical protein n=1 Tax=Dyella sp. 2RAB6 TaxID=3232992 RepID=UPI003F90FC1F